MWSKIKTKPIYIILFILFIVVSLIYISPMNNRSLSQYNSCQLKKVTIRNKDVDRTDYVNENNVITVAADQGYATKIITSNKNGCVEQYYDEKGEPAKKYNGCYGILKEYDNKDNSIKITYLDANGEPTTITNGYAVERQEYNENGKVIKSKYYDAKDKPIKTLSYGYGKENEYDESGRIRTIRYTDNNGKTMKNGQGYASIKRYYSLDEIENRKVESEFYFDESGTPTKLSLGQYGIKKKYDEYGREYSLTYLDEYGNPIMTNKGYASIVLSYHADNTIDTEKYYDIEGEPVSLSEGQYGIKREHNYILFLNKNGEELYNIKNVIYNHSWIVVPISLLLVLLSSVNGKIRNYLFLVIYICIIGYLTIMYREKDNVRNTYGFFHSFILVCLDEYTRADIIKNIWLFVPLGAILFHVYPKEKVLILPLLLSVLIEGIQFYYKLGFCELVDIISNSLGGFIGFNAGKLTMSLFERINRRKQIHSI